MTADVHAVSRRLAELGVPEGDARHVMLALTQLWVLTWTVRPAFDAPVVADPSGPRVPMLGTARDADARHVPVAPELDAMIVAVVDFYRSFDATPEDAIGVGSPWRSTRDAVGGGSPAGERPEIPLARMRVFGARRVADGAAPVPERPAMGPGPRPSDAERDALVARMAATWQETLDDLADR